MLWSTEPEVASLTYWHQADGAIGGCQDSCFSSPKEGLDLFAMQGGEHLVGNCVRLVFLVDIVVQRIDNLVEAKSHATLEVLRAVFRVRRSSTGLERVVDLLE